MSCRECEYDWAGFPVCHRACGRPECTPCARMALWSEEPAAAAWLDWQDAEEYAERAEEAGRLDQMSYQIDAMLAHDLWRTIQKREAGQGPEGAP